MQGIADLWGNEVKANSDKQIVLVVDDTPANIEVAHHTLKNIPIVKIATSGARALVERPMRGRDERTGTRSN